MSTKKWCINQNRAKKARTLKANIWAVQKSHEKAFEASGFFSIGLILFWRIAFTPVNFRLSWFRSKNRFSDQLNWPVWPQVLFRGKLIVTLCYMFSLKVVSMLYCSSKVRSRRFRTIVRNTQWEKGQMLPLHTDFGVLKARQSWPVTQQGYFRISLYQKVSELIRAKRANSVSVTSTLI